MPPLLLLAATEIISGRTERSERCASRDGEVKETDHDASPTGFVRASGKPTSWRVFFFWSFPAAREEAFFLD
jgi:hypothetical protein